jgi:hypothetical protein
MSQFQSYFDARHTPPVFIQSTLLERLVAGAFVPQRVRQVLEGETESIERRQANSRRYAIRNTILYEPRVFENRLSEIMRLASMLNTPETRVIFLSGASGSGKTTVLRGLIELFGGGPEQLVWVTPSVLDDADSLLNAILQQLLEGLEQDFHGMSNIEGFDEGFDRHFLKRASETPSRRQILLHQVLHVLMEKKIPLCVIFDSVSVLLDKQERLPAKIVDFLNQLLSYPNLKLILAGHHVPLGSLHRDAFAGMCHFVLAPLSLVSWRALLPTECRQYQVNSNATLAATQPWLAVWLSRMKACVLEQALSAHEVQDELNALVFALSNSSLTEASLSKDLQMRLIPFWANLWRYPQQDRPQLARNLLWILLCVRHPVTEKVMTQILTFLPDSLREGQVDDLSGYFQANTSLGCLLQRQGSFYGMGSILKTALLTYFLPTYWSEISRAHWALGRFYASQGSISCDAQSLLFSDERLKSESNYHAQKTGDPTTLLHLLAQRQNKATLAFESALLSDKYLQWPMFPAQQSNRTSDDVFQQFELAAGHRQQERSTPKTFSPMELPPALPLSEPILNRGLRNPDLETLVESYLAEGQWRSAAYVLAMAAREAEQEGHTQEAMEWYWQQGNVLWLEGDQIYSARQAYQAAYRVGQQTLQSETVMSKLQQRLESLG